MNYYRNERISDHIIRIIDFLDVACYLVIGNDRAALIDTCDGFGNIHEYASTLTDKPIFVILTHGHVDHAPGAVFFDEIYMNHNDMDLMKEHASLEFRMNSAKSDPRSRDIPVSEYAPEITQEIRDIKDGQEFDLGGITVKMILCKGHTQGMMMALIEEERTIIFGDGCGVGVLLFGPTSSCVSEYRKSLLTIQTHESEYDTVLRNHGTFWSPKELLENVIDCCDCVLNGTASGQTLVTHGIKFYIAKAVDEHENRLDGKQGNLKYTDDKAC